MPDLDLQALPPELQAALERAWPGCPEAQRRALLAPTQLGGTSIWPDHLWPWQPARRWWRTAWARELRQGSEAFFAAHLCDARGEPNCDVPPAYAQKLFDPEQPFFATPWTHARLLLRSPVPEVFSDADFWFFTQRLSGGDADAASRELQDWVRRMQAAGALHGGRRRRWLDDALWRLEMSANGTFT